MDDEAYKVASKLAHDLRAVPGVVDSHIFQIPNAPSLDINIDRTLATEFGINQEDIANNVLVDDQFQRSNNAEFLGRSTQRCQLPACSSDADLSYQFNARFTDDAGDRWEIDR